MENATAPYFEVTGWMGYNIFSAAAFISSFFGLITTVYLVNVVRKFRFETVIKILFSFIFLSSFVMTGSVCLNYGTYLHSQLIHTPTSSPISVSMIGCNPIRAVYLTSNIYITLVYVIITVVLGVSTYKKAHSESFLIHISLFMCGVAFITSFLAVLVLFNVNDPTKYQPHCLSISGSILGHNLYFYIYSMEFLLDVIVCTALILIFRKNKTMRDDYDKTLEQKHNVTRNLNATYQLIPVIGITGCLVAVFTLSAIILRQFQENFTQAEYMYYAYYTFFGPHLVTVQNVVFIVVYKMQGKNWTKKNQVGVEIVDVIKTMRTQWEEAAERAKSKIFPKLNDS